MGLYQVEGHGCLRRLVIWPGWLAVSLHPLAVGAEERARLLYDPRCRAHRRHDDDRGVLAERGTCRHQGVAEVNLLEVLNPLPGLESLVACCPVLA